LNEFKFLEKRPYLMATPQGGSVGCIDYMHICAYIRSVKFEWDRHKAVANRTKHGIDFADAVAVLYDELAVTIHEQHAEEERFITMGTDALGRVLVVVWACHGEQLRLISARKATPRERRHYEA
jgi:uncharacterized DUF497 family protein